MSSDILELGTSRAAPRTARSPWLIALCATAAGVLGGFVAARNGGATPPRDSIAQRTPGVASAAMTVDAWMARASSAVGLGRDPALRAELAQSLASSPTLRRDVIERYGREPERRVRGAVREILAASPTLDVAAVAVELAKRDDRLARAAGFELLAILQPSDEVYALVQRAIATETDPAALAGAVMALRPPNLASQSDARAVLPRLLALTGHGDALVRAHAVQQLADWDKVGDQATLAAERAIADGERVVRQAAVGAVMIGQLRSDTLKRSLLQVIGNAAEDTTTRAAALHALERFSLTDEELTRYRTTRSELERLPLGR